LSLRFSNTYNDWTEVGTSKGRTCWKHIERHGYPTWGTTIGDCVPWYSAGVPCPVKKYVFCCESSDPGGSAAIRRKSSGAFLNEAGKRILLMSTHYIS